VNPQACAILDSQIVFVVIFSRIVFTVFDKSVLEFHMHRYVSHPGLESAVNVCWEVFDFDQFDLLLCVGQVRAVLSRHH
jgi:hypothetical protein